MSRDDLQKLLHDLDEAIPALKREYPDEADFWPAFAGQADVILDEASAEDFEWVNRQTDLILAKHNIPLPPQTP